MSRDPNVWFQVKQYDDTFIFQLRKTGIASDIMSGVTASTMSKEKYLRIGEVVKRTGLSERMIRHYERLGLVAPDRSSSGQRLYDADALLSLAKVRLLKKAGLPLETIGHWLSNPMDGRSLIAAHLDFLRNEMDRVSGAIALLKDIDVEITRGGQTDIDHLARIISVEDDASSEARAREFFERHFSKRQHDEWRDMTERMGRIVNVHEYDDAWRSLIADIETELPLDPSSKKAQSMLKRWEELLKPFRQVASEEQQEMARKMWTNVDQWGAHARQPATQDVTDFIAAAYAAKANQSNRPQ